MQLTRLYRVYRAATTICAPLIRRGVDRKLRKAGVPEDRRRETAGQASLPRPDGPLIWFHAASVGESLSVLTLIARMAETLPRHRFLITSGTPTSAALIAARLPAHSMHQFAPLDLPETVSRFYRHWRPDAAVFVESELWPNMLVIARARGIPMALLNARLSRKSVEGWSKWPDTARLVLGCFEVIVTQNRANTDALLAMGANPERLRTGINLKSTSAPLPVDDALVARMQHSFAGRPVWLASSTHPGEEEIIADAHKRLLRRWPGLCLLLVPRHPERGAGLATDLARAGLTVARRAAGDAPGPETQVYLADTLGETGSWYSFADIAFIGGSLVPVGGHNPFEPAAAGAAILTGPHVENFHESFAPLLATDAARQVTDAATLADAVDKWLTHPNDRKRTAEAAARVAGRQGAALDEIITTLRTALRLTP
ncbi:MAG: 3-deoxy-D-manno-octulosonic acid transferase [Rhodobacteraceae bacterium]|nr:3-deoxy-D-manno-octulosonic acid transferase [Paracoccaceae bacterium]